MSNIKSVTLSPDEVQAVMNTVGRMPTSIGNGLYSFFQKKLQENEVPMTEKLPEETLTNEEEHG